MPLMLQGFAVAEQQLELPRGWLASGAPAPGAPQENGYANGANGAGAPAQPALRVTEEGDSIVITGPSLRAQARESLLCQLLLHYVGNTASASHGGGGRC